MAAAALRASFLQLPARVGQWLRTWRRRRQAQRPVPAVGRPRGHTSGRLRNRPSPAMQSGTAAVTYVLKATPGARLAFADLAFIEDVLLRADGGLRLVPDDVLVRATAQIAVLLACGHIPRAHSDALAALCELMRAIVFRSVVSPAASGFFTGGQADPPAHVPRELPGQDVAWLDTEPNGPPPWLDTLPGPSHG